MCPSVNLPDGRCVDLDYFVEWRQYLWRRPVAAALDFFGDLHGKHVLEIGGRSGRMTSLFAMCGARVTMLDRCDLDIPRKVQLHQSLGRRRTAGKLRRLLRTFEGITISEALRRAGDLPTIDYQPYVLDPSVVDRPPIFSCQQNRLGRSRTSKIG